MESPDPKTIADSSCRNEQAPNESSNASLKLDSPVLLQLQDRSPHLKIFTPSTRAFSELNTYFQLDAAPHPLAICRPTSEQEVAHIIRFATLAQIPITVRTGGHDSWGRSGVNDAIIIDMREMDSIVLSPDHKFARIGGGTISGNLTRFLAAHGLVVVQGGCASVGYTNWAACGGYSALNGSFGLGCDQIVGARVVNPSGEIVDADEELLWGLRGGGCNFGVVLALDVRVHSLPKMLAGLIAFPIVEARKVLLSYRELLNEEFPDAFGGLMGLMVIPGMGTVLMMMVTWSSMDLETGKKYVERIRGLGKAVMDTVSETTLAEWTKVGKAFSPTAIYTNIRTAYVKDLSEPFIALLLKHTSMIPAGSKAMFIIHIFHGQGAKSNVQSCFGMRESHIWVGIHGQTLQESSKKEAYAWADEVVLDLRKNGLMMSGGYVALMGTTEPVEACFGDNWDKLKELKRKLDQTSLFRYAVPSLS